MSRRVVWAVALLVASAAGRGVRAVPFEFTTSADFNQGTLVNTNTAVPGQVELNTTLTTFPFVWVACSGRGTTVKIDANTGAVLGEYRTAPQGQPTNPSRTTVDQSGSVWVANRDQASGNSGSIVHIGLTENHQAVDRNGSGTIDTSTGLGDIRPWTNAGGADTNGGVSTAQDEAILHYVRLPDAPNARHVSVDQNNKVWVAGYPFVERKFYQLDASTGAVLDSFIPQAGGYGGLVDGRNVLWSAGLSQNEVLRYDIATDTQTVIPLTQPYGMGLDSNGNVWVAQWEYNRISKISPAGVVLATYLSGGSGSRGVAITADDHVWIANSHSNTVTHMRPDGTIVTTIPVGAHPTGVAVDSNGKIWVTNYNGNSAMRINPATNAVDLTVNLGAGANPYNYSDMTGIVSLAGTSPQGTLRLLLDGGAANYPWFRLLWNTEAGGTAWGISFQGRAANSPAGLGGVAFVDLANDVDFGLFGQYFELLATFRPDASGATPVLSNLIVNQPRQIQGVVPEPLSALLAALGLSALALRRSRRTPA